LNGKLEYNIDGRDISLESGDVIFIPTGSVRTRHESEGNADYISFNFTSFGDFKLPLVMRNAVRSEVAMLVAAYDKMCKHAYYDNKEKAGYLCGCILSVLKDIAAASQYSPLTKKIMGHIHSDISQKITLEEIGKLTFFSPIYCDSVFKKETGRSIIDYVLDRRIDEAKRLLLEGTMTLAQISEALGFNDYNYFSRVFKKRSGYSPTAYRRLVLAEFAT
jgi:YesN/AraC family two-component response regulator